MQHHSSPRCVTARTFVSPASRPEPMRRWTALTAALATIAVLFALGAIYLQGAYPETPGAGLYAALSATYAVLAGMSYGCDREQQRQGRRAIVRRRLAQLTATAKEGR